MLRTLLLAALLTPFGCAAPAQVDPGPDGPVIGPGKVPSADTEAARDALADARAQWDAADLGAYQMTLSRLCFCPSPDYTGPFAVTVRDDGLMTVRLDGDPVDAERGMTVEALFTLLEDAYDEEAAQVTVEYHDELGYPTSLSIDYDVRIADEEIGYRVSDLRELAG